MTPRQTIERIAFRIEDYFTACDAWRLRKGQQLMRMMRAKQRTLFDVVVWSRRRGITIEPTDGVTEGDIIQRLVYRIDDYHKQYKVWEQTKTDTDMKYLRQREQVLRDACAWLRKQGYMPGLTDGVIYQRLNLQ